MALPKALRSNHGTGLAPVRLALTGDIVELQCVEAVIENEIAQGCTQRSVAQTYALGLRSSWPTDWQRVNAVIVARWSASGLERVKRMAWSGKAFEERR